MQTNLKTGISSEFLVLSCLIRKNYEAYFTIGNAKKTDIRVVVPGTDKALSVDVKAVKDYSSFIVDNIKEEKNHYIIFVCYNKKIEDVEYMPEMFIVPSLEVNQIISDYNGKRRVNKGSLTRYKNKWEFLA